MAHKKESQSQDEVTKVVTKTPTKRVVLVVFLVVAVVTAGVLIFKSNETKTHNAAVAAGQTSISLTPAAAEIKAGDTLEAAVVIDTKGKPVNAVQANLSYPTDKFEYAGTNNDGSAFPVAAQTVGGSGNVNISRGAMAPVSNQQIVTKVKFRALASSSEASITFAKGTVVLSSETNTNLLGQAIKGTYVIK